MLRCSLIPSWALWLKLKGYEASLDTMADLVGNSKHPTDFGQKELLQWNSDEDGLSCNLCLSCCSLFGYHLESRIHVYSETKMDCEHLNIIWQTRLIRILHVTNTTDTGKYHANCHPYICIIGQSSIYDNYYTHLHWIVWFIAIQVVDIPQGHRPSGISNTEGCNKHTIQWRCV